MSAPTVQYKELSLLPRVIAEQVCSNPYDGREWSEGCRNPFEISKVENLRQQMTPTQIAEFAKLCDERCEAAYNQCSSWFVSITKAKGNKGRDQLYIWVLHWLVAYLQDPDFFKKKMEV